MKAIISLLNLVLASGVVTACSILPTQAPLSAVYDLGPQQNKEAEPTFPYMIRIDSVTEPEWLSGTKIHYRLLYDNPQQLRSYADSRWAGTPGELVQHGIEHALSNTKVAQKSPLISYGIDMHVQEFEQQFTSAESASVVLQVRVTLKRYPDQGTIAEHLFSYRGKSALNARGAADAMSSLEHEFAESLLDWIQVSTADKKVQQ